MKNMFLEKSYRKCSGEASPRHFYKKSKLSISLNQQKWYKVCFYCMSSPKYIKTKVLTTCFSWINFFQKKNKMIWYYSPWLIFCMIFEGNICHNMGAWQASLVEILCNICLVIICFQVYNVTNFEITLRFLIKPFSYMTKESRQKCKYLTNKKSLNMK